MLKRIRNKLNSLRAKRRASKARKRQIKRVSKIAEKLEQERYSLTQEYDAARGKIMQIKHVASGKSLEYDAEKSFANQQSLAGLEQKAERLKEKLEDLDKRVSSIRRQLRNMQAAKNKAGM